MRDNFPRPVWRGVTSPSRRLRRVADSDLLQVCGPVLGEGNALAARRFIFCQDHAAAVSARAGARDDILCAAVFSAVDRFIFKRSRPFGRPRKGHSPDLWDIGDLFPGSRHVAIYRDPPVATYSAFRR
jgi:hypothetical protein